MIYIHRNWDLVPVAVRDALRAAASELDAIADADGRKAYIHANSGKWTAVREFLSNMSHGKCWYSEAREAVSRYQVDHFRPHGRAKQATKDYSDGYSWLAFDIENFRLAGMLCNTVNQEYADESIGKGDWFPLIDPTRRASLQNRDTKLETPVLLDPADPDDPYKLWFNEDGNVEADPELPAEQRVLIEDAIKYLGLRQSRLNGKRRSVLLNALRAVRRYRSVDRIPKGTRTARDIENLAEARSELLAMSAPTGEFAAAVRCILHVNGLRHLIDRAELQALALPPEDV